MANTKIPSELIADSSITAAKLADGTITTADIADSNVTTAKIADSNVTTAKIGDAQVTTAKIIDANVTTGKIADDAVTTAKMASNSVTSDTIASGITLAGTTNTGALSVTGNITIPTGNKISFDTDGLTYISEDQDERLRFWVANTEFMRMTNTGTDELRLLPYGGNLFAGGNLDVTGNIVVSGTVDGVDIQTLNTTAGAALPKAGGTMTGALTITGGSSGADLYINNTSPTLGFTDSNSFSDASDIYIVRGASTGDLQFQFFDDSANTTTTTFQIDETGNTTITGTVALADDKELQLGNSADITFKHHNSGYGHLENSGILYIDAEQIQLRTDNSDVGLALTLNASHEALFAGKVGVKTTSPQYDFDVYSTSDISMRIHRPSSGLGLTDTCGIGFSHRGDTNTSSSDTRAAIVSTYNGSLFLCTEPGGNLNSNPVDHAALSVVGTTQNIGIGTTTPDHQLDIENSSHAVARLHAGTNSSASLRLQNDAQHWDVNLQTNDKFAIYDHTAGTQPFTIMPTTGNVGIGVTVPTSKLTLPLEEESNFKIKFQAASGTGHAGLSTVDQSGAGLYIGANSYVNASGVPVYGRSDHPSSGIYFDGWNADRMRFYTGTSGNPTEKMTITSAGDVGIGTTDVDLGYTDGDDGVLIKPAGLVQVARDSAYAALYINKLNNTNGAMIDLHADGTKVGILSNLSGRMGIGSGDTGIFFDSTRDCISPFTMTGNDGRASAIDIGRSGVQFKDLYLSGAAYVPDVRSTTNQYFTHQDGNFAVFRDSSGAERMRIHANGHVSLGTVTDLAFVRPVYRKNITVNKTYTALFNTNGAQLASGFVINIHGTGSSTVVNAKFDVLVNHYQDITISALGTYYTLCKIKVVTNGNEDCTVYAAINSPNATSCTIEVQPLHNTTLEFSPSSVFSTNYFIHEASGGHTVGTTGGMPAGAGTTTGYS